MSKRWSTVLAVAFLVAVPIFAAPAPPVRLAAEGEDQVYDVSSRAAQMAELHRSIVARESARGAVASLPVGASLEERVKAALRVLRRD